MLQRGFFLTNSSNPDKPQETWTQVYQKTNAGNASYSAGWGRYKIVFSGGGGSGAALSRTQFDVNVDALEAGTRGDEKTVYLNVYYGTTKSLTGEVGAGGNGGTVAAYNDSPTATAGTGGSGYQNGGNSATIAEKHYRPYESDNSYFAYAMASGSGGGSTSFLIDGALNSVAPGGNGGECKVTYKYRQTSSQYSPVKQNTVTRNGATGGNGGAISKNGAAGGSSTQVWRTTGTGGRGTDGYFIIYKSNLKPEPL